MKLSDRQPDTDWRDHAERRHGDRSKRDRHAATERDNVPQESGRAVRKRHADWLEPIECRITIRYAY